MGKRFIRNWDKFVETSSEFLIENTNKSRVTLKYRNKAPSNGKLYVTNDNHSFMYKFTEKADLDKLDSYLKSTLHMLANKPIEISSNTLTTEIKAKDSKKKAKKVKKH